MRITLRMRFQMWLRRQVEGPNLHDYTITVKWNGGGDRAAMELQTAIGWLVRDIDPAAKFVMHGNTERDTGAEWLSIHQGRAQAWREKLHGAAS